MPEIGGRRAEDGCEDSFDGVDDDDGPTMKRALRMWMC